MDNKLILPCEVENVSDGYHTFKELYDHRITLYIALCRKIYKVWELEIEKIIADMKEQGIEGGIEQGSEVWRAKNHFDGSCFEGWFILGMFREAGKQITYHLPLSRWDETDFAETFENAPVDFDGHTSADVLERLKSL